MNAWTMGIVVCRYELAVLAIFNTASAAHLLTLSGWLGQDAMGCGTDMFVVSRRTKRREAE